MAATDIITTKQMTKYVLKMLRVMGCDPTKRTFIGKFLFWMYAPAAILLSLGSIVKCIQQTSLESFAVTYVDYLAVSQTASKTFCLFFLYKTTGRLLERMWHEFWPVDKIPELKDKHNALYKFFLRGAYLYGCILVLCLVFFSCRGVLTTPKSLPFNIYFLGYEDSLLLESPYYELFYILEIIFITLIYSLMLAGHDILFIILCGSLVTQFDMLKYQFLLIGKDEEDEEKSYNILKECVKHHSILLEFIEDLDRLVTLSLLKQCIDETSCLAVYLYVLQVDFTFNSLFGFYTCFCQAFFFAIFGQLIRNRSDAIGKAAYNNHWYMLKSRRIHQGLKLVIQRTQKPVKLSIGGFMYLSFESLTTMLKAAGSIVAVLNSIKDKQNM